MSKPSEAPPTKPSTPLPRLIALGALGLGLVVLGGAFVQKGLAPKPVETALPEGCNARAFAEIGGPFSLVNQDNVAVTEKTFVGKPALIYFGFTYCPDICPLSLQTMRLALDEAKKVSGSKAGDIQPILISLDPERDTPAALKAYVTSGGFPEKLQGLTGSVEQVTAAAKAFKVGFRKSVPEGSSAGDYLIDHTSIFYLLDRQGKLATFFSADPDPKVMGQCLAALSKNGL
jgi:protein SCO1/2